MNQVYFELAQNGQEWYFRLKGANGKTLMVSQPYARRSVAQHAIQVVKNLAPHATVRFATAPGEQSSIPQAVAGATHGDSP